LGVDHDRNRRKGALEALSRTSTNRGRARDVLDAAKGARIPTANPLPRDFAQGRRQLARQPAPAASGSAGRIFCRGSLRSSRRGFSQRDPFGARTPRRSVPCQHLRSNPGDGRATVRGSPCPQTWRGPGRPWKRRLAVVGRTLFKSCGPRKDPLPLRPLEAAAECVGGEFIVKLCTPD